jgi:biopolymer transport protein ExbD
MLEKLMRILIVALGACVLVASACAQDAPKDAPKDAQPKPAAPAIEAKKAKIPHVEVDVKKRQVRVEAQALRPEMPLEFLAVQINGPEHEAVIRSPVRASDLHLALLMIGLEPGEPVKYSPATQKWSPPHGPPLQIFFEYEKDGKTQSVPAYRWLRSAKTKEAMPPLTWIFAGSRVMEDGVYAADVTGYLVSVVNFDLTVIDIPKLASNANELLEWEANPDVVPETGTKVTMVIEPAGKADVPPNGEAGKEPARIAMPLVKVEAAGSITLNRQPIDLEHLTERLEAMKQQRPIKVRFVTEAGLDKEKVDRVRQAIEAADVEVEEMSASTGDEDAAGLRIDEARMQSLRDKWQKAVAPHDKALREAAQAHYEVIGSLRKEQQRLIDEADRIQRLIDELEKDYQEMTTPRPEPVGP